MNSVIPARLRRSFLGCAAALCLAGAFLVTATPAGATNVGNESAFRTAWTNAAETKIDLTADITLTCATGTPARNSSTDIVVDGHGHTITFDTNPCTSDLLSQAGTGRIVIQNATLTLHSTSGSVLSDSGSNSPITFTSVTLNLSSATGQGISSGNGSVDLTNTTFSIATTSAGSGISGGGNITLTDSSIAGTTNGGDGVSAGGGLLKLTRSTLNISNPSSSGSDISYSGDVLLIDSQAIGSSHSGEAISAFGTVTLQGSTVAFPSATGDGINTGGAVSVTNSTVTNSGEIGISTPGAVTLVYADIVHNGAGGSGGFNVSSGSLTTFASVLAKDPAGNCSVVAATTTHGDNYADDTTCGLTGSGDRQSTGNDPKLGSLANNGGPTPTLLPQSGSPLIDGVAAASCQSDGASGITTDQRGLARPDAGKASCDVGAVEVQVAAPVKPPVPAAGAGSGLGLGILLITTGGLVTAFARRSRRRH